MPCEGRDQATARISFLYCTPSAAPPTKSGRPSAIGVNATPFSFTTPVRSSRYNEKPRSSKRHSGSFQAKPIEQARAAREDALSTAPSAGYLSPVDRSTAWHQWLIRGEATWRQTATTE